MGYQPTTEVTAEQVFAWAKEDWDKQDSFPLPKMRRGYLGLVRMAEGGGDIEAYQDAVFSHGYRVIYWRFTDGRPREVCAVEKADAAERARWGKPKAPTGPRKYVCSRMRDAKEK